MPKFLRELNANAERWALLVFYVLLVTTMAIEVVRREVFAYSSVWGEEIVRYSFIYLGWIGASAAVRERAHIRIDVLLHFLGRRLRTIVYIFGDLVMLAVALVAMYWSWKSVAVSWRFGSVSQGLRLPMTIFLAAVPIAFSLMLVRLIQSLSSDLAALRFGKWPFEGNKLFD